jgi:hypothetical protein
MALSPDALDLGDSDKITDVGWSDYSIGSCGKRGPFRVFGSLFRGQDIPDRFFEQRFLVERPIPQFLPKCQNFGGFRTGTL